MILCFTRFLLGRFGQTLLSIFIWLVGRVDVYMAQSCLCMFYRQLPGLHVHLLDEGVAGQTHGVHQGLDAVECPSVMR